MAHQIGVIVPLSVDLVAEFSSLVVKPPPDWTIYTFIRWDRKTIFDRSVTLTNPIPGMLYEYVVRICCTTAILFAPLEMEV